MYEIDIDGEWVKYHRRDIRDHGAVEILEELLHGSKYRATLDMDCRLNAGPQS